ncbi:MAG TPA: hypothetical protein VMH31_02120 [Methylomirabilota bacterium]|nr:hypothetical protein [Methylomirabilota bacterium]
MSRLSHLAALLVFAVLVSTAARAQEPKPPVPAQYAATAIGQAGAVAGKTFGMNIYIDGTTSDGERDELLGILKQKGQDGVVKKFSDTKDLGRVAPTGSVGTGMRFVRIRPTPNGGLHIIMATDRPISFPELYNSTRSTDYPIGIVVLDVDKNGKGTGKFAPLCKVKFNKKGELEIENYGQKPFRLANVYREK